MSIVSIFVTVGTTEFDELIESIDNKAFIESIASLNCRRLNIQIGRGTYLPKHIEDECAKRNIMYSCFRFKPTLDEDMKSADLIISHCGAGSILECLTLKKLFIVVVNETLQGNHQTELAEVLAEGKHCISTIPRDLREILCTDLSRRLNELLPYPTPNPELFPDVVDSLFDWESP